MAGISKSKKAKKCVYCGVVADDRDHVPPRSIFPLPRPTNLITVPSCKTCNGSRKSPGARSRSDDDEYLRLILAMRWDVSETPAGREALAAALRGLAMPEKRRMLRSLKRSLTPLDVTTPSGLFVERAATYRIDYGKLDRAVERIARGLYYFESGERVPDGYRVMKTYHGDGLTARGRRMVIEEVGKLTPGSRSWPDVFAYRFGRPPDEPKAALVAMEFFNAHFAMCFIADPVRVVRDLSNRGIMLPPQQVEAGPR